MKLSRWALAGASAYVVYKYTIGKKTKGEDVFVAEPDGAEAGALPPARESAAPPKRSKARKGAKAG